MKLWQEKIKEHKLGAWLLLISIFLISGSVAYFGKPKETEVSAPASVVRESHSLEGERTVDSINAPISEALPQAHTLPKVLPNEVKLTESVQMVAPQANPAESTASPGIPKPETSETLAIVDEAYSDTELEASDQAPIPEELTSSEEPTATEPILTLPVQEDVATGEALPQSTDPTGKGEISSNEDAPNRKLVDDIWFNGGASVDFTSYSQNVPSMSDVTFGKISAPSWHTNGGFLLSESLGLDLRYRDVPGEALSSSSITVSNGEFHWKKMSAEVLIGLSDFERQSGWILRAGLERHEMPFFVPLSANSIDLRNSNINQGTLGLEYRKITKGGLRLEYKARYLHPFSATGDVGADFSVTPKVAIDAGISASKQIGELIQLGIGIETHYQKHSFEYRLTNGSSFSGSQEFLHTNFSAILGISF